MPSKIDLDFDAIDKRIDELYYQKFTRAAIAERLQADFNVTWHPDFVGRRHRAYIDARRLLHDAELDIKLADWHEDDVGIKDYKCPTTDSK